MVMIGLATVTACLADEFNLRWNDSGPIKVTTTLTLDEKSQPHLSIEVINQTALPIQRLELCVTSPSFKKGCLFTVWTKKELGVDEEFTVDASSDRKIPNAMHSVQIASMEQSAPPKPRSPSKFDQIRNIFVEEIGGNTGPQLRDRLIATVVNSGRFTAVEKPELADAVLRGRSDSIHKATEVGSTSKGGAGALAGVVLAGGTSSSVTEEILSESVSVRLTLPSGEVIWGWDDSKPCKESKARCAIDDLTSAAKK
jgi:hypothetical protein